MKSGKTTLAAMLIKMLPAAASVHEAKLSDMWYEAYGSFNTDFYEALAASEKLLVRTAPFYYALNEVAIKVLLEKKALKTLPECAKEIQEELLKNSASKALLDSVIGKLKIDKSDVEKLAEFGMVVIEDENVVLSVSTVDGVVFESDVTNVTTVTLSDLVIML